MDYTAELSSPANAAHYTVAWAEARRRAGQWHGGGLVNGTVACRTGKQSTCFLIKMLAWQEKLTYNQSKRCKGQF
jgi:hypothetical protein